MTFTYIFSYFIVEFYAVNRCWEPRVLEQMSSHYETKKPLSPELIEKIVKRYYSSV